MADLENAAFWIDERGFLNWRNDEWHVKESPDGSFRSNVALKPISREDLNKALFEVFKDG